MEINLSGSLSPTVHKTFNGLPSADDAGTYIFVRKNVSSEDILMIYAVLSSGPCPSPPPPVPIAGEEKKKKKEIAPIYQCHSPQTGTQKIDAFM